MSKALRRLKSGLKFLHTSWSILGITLLVLLLVEGTFRGIFAVKDHFNVVPLPDRRIIAEGYAGETWPVDHFRELEQLEERWRPYVYFRQKRFRGKTINIDDDGLRATWQSSRTAQVRGERRSVKILMLGGSSLWGFGARDDQTIPSLVAHALHEKGWSVELKNLAEIGYVSTQEVIALTRELQAGYRPDVVIFYDGVNDTTSALLEGEPGLTTNEINRRREFNLLQSPARLAIDLGSKLVQDSGSYRFAQVVRRRLSGQSAQPVSTPATFRIPDVAQGVAGHYEANISLVEALARSFGFRPLFFWQPTVFTKATLVPIEEEEARKFAWAEPFMSDVYDQITASAALKSDPAFHDLSTIFDDTDHLVFIDYCHTTETANERIASVMAATVIKALARGSDPKAVQ